MRWGFHGKTIQAIGLINVLDKVEKLERVLIVCPATLKVNWKRELEKWLVVKRNVELFDGKTFNPDAEIGVINFDNLHKHEGKYKQYGLLIVDECHYCANPKAKRTKACFSIPAKRKLDMSGTPMTNRPKNLWTILNHLNPTKFGNFFLFAKRYCAAKQIHIGGGRYAWDFDGASNIEELQRELRSNMMIRRMKMDVLKELPAKRRQVIPLPRNGAADAINAEMEAFEKRKALIEELQAQVELAKITDDSDGYAEALAKLESEINICFQEMAKARHDVGMAKVPYAIEQLRTNAESGIKTVVFAHHIDVINAMFAEFSDCSVMVTGSTSQKLVEENGKITNDRQKAVDRFQTDPNCLFFFGQDQAAAEGLTLTASANVVFVEFGWVPGKIQQCEDRTHRLGQMNSVLIQFLVMEGSVDAIMAEKVAWKLSVIERSLDRDCGKIEAPGETPKSVAYSDEPMAPVNTVTATKQELEAEAPKLSDEQMAAILQCLQILAGMDTDHASQRNGVGFNGCDTRIGHALAGYYKLTPKAAVLGRKIVRKYSRQLGEAIYKAAIAV